jgi:hypothetical protein
MTGNPWDILAIHPLFRCPGDPSNFEPILLTSGENRVSRFFHLNGMRYFGIFGSSTVSFLHLSLSIGSVTVVRFESPVSNYPLEITQFLSEGYNTFVLTTTAGDGEVAFTVLPLVHLTELEIEIDIMSRQPYLSGGSIGFCPISHGIVEVPVRGIACTHTDNVDLQAYVKDSEVGRNWTCPVCGKPLPYEEVYLDGDAYNAVREFVLEDPMAFLMEEG